MLRNDRLWWVLLAIAVGVGAALGSRRPAGSRGDAESGAAGAPREPWTCACGQAFVFTGRDRHRVYWIAGAEEADPVLGGSCPTCARALPV